MAEGILDRRAGHPRIARNAVVGLHPQPALRVDADAVGAGEGVAVDIADDMAAARRERRVAGEQEDVPCKARRQRTGARFAEPDYMTVQVGDDGAGWVGAVWSAESGRA